MVKKEVFEWIITGKKTIELRRGKAKAGEQAVFQCGRKILRGKIVRTDEGNLLTLLQKIDFKQIIPTAHNVEEAKAYVKKAIRNDRWNIHSLPVYFAVGELRMKRILRMKCVCREAEERLITLIREKRMNNIEIGRWRGYYSSLKKKPDS